MIFHFLTSSYSASTNGGPKNGFGASHRDCPSSYLRCRDRRIRRSSRVQQLPTEAAAARSWNDSRRSAVHVDFRARAFGRSHTDDRRSTYDRTFDAARRNRAISQHRVRVSFIGGHAEHQEAVRNLPHSDKQAKEDGVGRESDQKGPARGR